MTDEAARWLKFALSMLAIAWPSLTVWALWRRADRRFERLRDAVRHHQGQKPTAQADRELYAAAELPPYLPPARGGRPKA